MTRLLTCLALLALCMSPFAEEVVADESPGLGILKAQIRFGKPGRGDSLTVKGVFDPSLVPPTFSSEQDTLSAAVGPVTLISSVAIDARGTVKSAKPGKFVYLVKKTRDEPDSLKLAVDLAKGKFCLKARRTALDTLRSAGPEDVTFTLVLGDAVFTGTITMGEKDGRWRFRYVPGSGGWPPGIPGINPGGGGGGGGTGGGGAAVGFRTLGRKAPYAGPMNFNTVIARTDSVYRSEWILRFGFGPPTGYAPPAPVPFVDFTKEMVVFIDIGVRPTSGFSVDVMKVTKQGTGLKIEWRETRPGANCGLLSALTYPCVAVAVPLRDGAVTYSGSARTLNCP
jgi:hypothetical protein